METNIVERKCLCHLYDKEAYHEATGNHCYECDAFHDGRLYQAEISFPLGFGEGKKAGIKEVVDYFSGHWMGQTRGMLLYEIPVGDRCLLEDDVVPSSKIGI